MLGLIEGWTFLRWRGPNLNVLWAVVLTVAVALLSAGVVKAQPVSPADTLPAPCPIEAPALARLRAEHAAMDRAGVACLQALDAARADRDRCQVAAEAALDDLARELAEASAQLDAAGAALAAPLPPPEASAGRPWALVALGGVVVAGAAGAAAALDAGPVEVAGVGLGVAAVAAGVAAVVAWAVGE